MNTNIFTDKDIEKINAHGISLEEIDSQIKKFKSGIPYTILEKPATISSGIFDLKNFDHEELLSYYQKAANEGRLSKFVPASGAATRMFKDLISYFNSKTLTDNTELSEKELEYVASTMSNIEKFPFYEDLKRSIEGSGMDMGTLINSDDCITILDFLLFDKGLNYSNLPKALLKFSKDPVKNKTALEEHFIEGLQYSKDKDNSINLHFTVSEEHQTLAEELSKDLIESFLPDYKFNVTFSNQKHSTDTLAVNEDNEPFRDKNDSIILRPGGHGALIHNLNSFDGDIVFIKNIDNVQRNGKDLSIYKKLLAGILLKVQCKIFNYIEQLKSNELNNLSEIENFISKELNIYLNDEYYNGEIPEKTEQLLSLLIRPIRVCGMVKNTGAPGGGPFFLKKNNEISLQIVESSQIDMSNDNQKKIFLSSTHFNPVDIVCGVRDNEGDAFNLLNYVDPETYFISNKSIDGKPLKALELPGLWNGAMADWITIFVEVPLETFTPVKTVNDLL